MSIGWVNLSWEIFAKLYYKEWTLSGSYRKPQKGLSTEEVWTGENGSNISLMWKRGNWAIWTGAYFFLQKDGAVYESEGLGEARRFYHRTTIADNRNMFVLGLQWNMQFGTKAKRDQRRLYNRDNRNSVLLVQ